MKTIQKNYRTVFSALFLGLMLMFTACQKEEVVKAVVQDEVPAALPGKYRRVIELHDGASSAKLAIASDDESALDAFGKTVRFQAVPGIDSSTSEANITPVPKEYETNTELPAVHVCILEEHLGPGMQGFSMTMGATSTAVKATYIGTFHSIVYKHSYSAPHYFKATPLNGNCVSTWLKQRSSSYTNTTNPWPSGTGGSAGSYCTWAGGAGGNFLCSFQWAASSSVSSLEYQLKAQGNNFRLEWY